MNNFSTADIPLQRIQYTNDGGTYEGLYLAASEPKILTIFIHGHNTFGAWELLFPAQRLLSMGHSVFLPSQSGFGGSHAAKDYCGPSTVAATETLLEHLLRSHSELNELPMQVWGISRGATVAGKLMVGAHKDKIVRGVLQSGVYDHVMNYTDSKKPEDIKANITKETGGSIEELEKRSLVHDVALLSAPILIVHGEEDQNVDVSQAHTLKGALESSGKQYELRIVPGAGHNLSGPAHFREIIVPFLDES